MRLDIERCEKQPASRRTGFAPALKWSRVVPERQVINGDRHSFPDLLDLIEKAWLILINEELRRYGRLGEHDVDIDEA